MSTTTWCTYIFLKDITNIFRSSVATESEINGAGNIIDLVADA